MSREQFEAHMRMLSSLNVRTIAARPDIHHFSPMPGRRSRSDTVALHQRIKELKARGKANHEIADELGVSRPTVGKHLRGFVKTTA